MKPMNLTLHLFGCTHGNFHTNDFVTHS